MRLGREKKGQFIIIAALMMAIMIISISSIIYSSVTYFKHERWEEYVVLVDSIKTGSSRVMEVSLSNYTQTLNSSILTVNLNQWSLDVKQIYPGFGVVLTPTLATGSYRAYGEDISYTSGLAYQWFVARSYSVANASFDLSLSTVGLTGYKFVSYAFLRETILGATYSNSLKRLSVYLSIEMEDLIPVTALKQSSFSLRVDGASQTFSFSRYYSSTYNMFVYELRRDISSAPARVSVTVVDARGIQVIANSTVTQV